MSKITVSERGPGREKKRRYQIKFRLYRKAKPSYVTVEADTKSEAREEGMRIYAEMKSKHDHPVEVKSDSVHLKDIEDFIRMDLTSDGVAPNTVKRFLGATRSFFGKFLPEKHPEIVKMSVIKSDIFGDYKDYLRSIGRDKGWSSEVRVLKPIFSRLVRRRHCPEKVYGELKKFKSPKQIRREGVIISKTEQRQLLDAIKKDRPDYWGITYFILRSAWRITEVCSIKKVNVKTNGFRPVEIVSEIADRKIKYDFHFKAIDDDLANVVKQFLYSDRKVYLFANRNNKRHSYRHYEEYLAMMSQKILGKRLTPTDLRKTCITELVASGASPNDVMAITGHKDYETVISFYASPTEGGIKKGLEATRI